MATYTQRGSRWQVKIRIRGRQIVSQTFDSKIDAVQWATPLEKHLRGSWRKNKAVNRRMTLAKAMLYYIEKGELENKTATTRRIYHLDQQKKKRLLFLHEQSFAQLPLCKIHPLEFIQWRDERLE